MDNFPIKKLGREYWPTGLHHIPEKPNLLYYRGALPDPDHKFLCVIGPRKHNQYGEKVCEELIAGLKGFPITIVSGLAYGIDSVAHKMALDYNLKTIALPGSGLNKNVIYPKAHFNLAMQILESGGTLISEYSPDTEAAPWTFPKRNRLMAGISDAVMVIEAGHKSGTMITSRLALDYNRSVLAVPGSIFNLGSTGTNALIKEGAVPITSSADILLALGFNDEQINLFSNLNLEKKIRKLSREAKNILEALTEPKNIDQVSKDLEMPVSQILQNLTDLEMNNLVKEVDGYYMAT